MAKGRKAKQAKTKLNMIIYGDTFTGKTTLASQIAFFKREDGSPFRVLYIDAESGGLDSYLDRMEESGINLDNIYILYTQSLAEVRQYIAKVKNNEDIYELDDDGVETDEVVTDAEGKPFRADAIVVDGTTILNLTTQSGLVEFSKKLISPVVLMDEASMVNVQIFLAWLEAIDDNTKIIICGDYKQLPPIGFGNIFSDLIHCLPKENINELTKVMRQAEKSGILTDANLIRDNKNPIIEVITSKKLVHGELQDMYYMFRDTRDSLHQLALKMFFSAVESDGVDNVGIAVPRREGCLNSAYELNKDIVDVLLKDEKKSISFGEKEFKLGCKVVQTVNDYDRNVFNGEIGYITFIGEDMSGKKPVTYCEVTYQSFGPKIEKGVGLVFDEDNNIVYEKQDKVIRYEGNELADLDMAYALTTHKMQGSSRKTVICVIDNTHYKLLDNCMLYTMLTRAKKRCLLCAEPQAFYKCLNTSNNARNTWLSTIKRKGK